MLEVFILLVNSSSAFLVWKTFDSISRKALQEKLIAIASTAAAGIDVEGHEQIKNQENEGDFAYQKIYGFLEKIRESNSGIDSIYTMRKTMEENQWEFIFDASKEIDLNENGIIDEDEIMKKLDYFEKQDRANLKKYMTGKVKNHSLV